MIELKPCPFCGGRAELKENVVVYPPPTVTRYTWVECHECGAEHGLRSNDEDETIAAWNTRKEPQQ